MENQMENVARSLRKIEDTIADINQTFRVPSATGDTPEHDLQKQMANETEERVRHVQKRLTKQNLETRQSSVKLIMDKYQNFKTNDLLVHISTYIKLVATRDEDDTE